MSHPRPIVRRTSGMVALTVERAWSRFVIGFVSLMGVVMAIGFGAVYATRSMMSRRRRQRAKERESTFGHLTGLTSSPPPMA